MTRMHAKRCANQRGSIMAFALGFMVLLLIIAAGVHGLVVSQLRGSAELRQRVAAYSLAEGGIARTMAWFNATNYQMPEAEALTDSVPVRLSANNVEVVLPTYHPDTYTDAFGQARKSVTKSFAEFLSNQTGSVGTYNVVTSLMARQPETWEVLATAQVGATTQQVGALLVRSQQSLFADALFGREYVTMGGNATTDSYDSSVGGYGGKNVLQTGSVRSNNDISLYENAAIRGDAMPGPDHEVSTTGNATVTGRSDPASDTKQLPAPVLPGDMVNLDAIAIKGNGTQTLTAGNYLAPSLSISGNGQLVIDASLGPVNLYVSGSISIAGNGINNLSGKPASFNLVETGNAGVSFSGNGTYFGTVYAPNSVLSLTGNGDMYGAFVGAGIGISGNGLFHFDELLKTQSAMPGPLRLVAQWTPPTVASIAEP